MKKIFAFLILSFLILNGCGSSQSEKETPSPSKPKSGQAMPSVKT